MDVHQQFLEQCLLYHEMSGCKAVCYVESRTRVAEQFTNCFVAIFVDEEDVLPLLLSCRDMVCCLYIAPSEFTAGLHREDKLHPYKYNVAGAVVTCGFPGVHVLHTRNLWFSYSAHPIDTNTQESFEEQRSLIYVPLMLWKTLAERQSDPQEGKESEPRLSSAENSELCSKVQHVHSPLPGSV
ncbi:hypothetical protein AV530_018825 [Patagioenas fasciata monilis]|uniref:Uncharacterized protein n=1 Tax=Patagioenas fasciata monilis TaxID=372326 RepID=A0A1V4JJM4_PATFA|nr:hypothetical protein AV530_018825 [Patagioenas fasciata monilis]